MIERPAQLGPRNPYAQIDPVLLPWAEEHGRPYMLDAREGIDIRSFQLRNARNRTYKVSIDYPAEDGTTNIHIRRIDNRGAVTITSGISDLRTNLDLVYDIAMKGRPTGESTRLPPPRWIQLVLKWLHLDKP